MTPGARVAASIDILDAILGGDAAEKALTVWARRSRFAGSKDRAAIRDHVFHALRNLRHFCELGGGSWPPTGRSVMLGAVRADGGDEHAVFCGEGYAPAHVATAEAPPESLSEFALWNLPEPLVALFGDELGQHARDQAACLCTRAPITLRVNTTRTTRSTLAEMLSNAGFETRLNPVSDTALTLTGHGRGLTNTDAFHRGYFEMQDAGSQALVDALPLQASDSVLDYCAGGGGKSLAMAARFGCRVDAHDANVKRMGDVLPRAKRAGTPVRVVTPTELDTAALYSHVLVDAPCSGSGSWRRSPDEKWRFSQEKLTELCALQRSILTRAAQHVAPGGGLSYVTCSLFPSENMKQVDWFVSQNAEWECTVQNSWSVDGDTDGFFLAQLKRK